MPFILVSGQIGEDTAVRLGQHRSVTVVGDGSAVVLDPAQARWWTGPNGAIGAANVLLNTFGAGEVLHSR